MNKQLKAVTFQDPQELTDYVNSKNIKKEDIITITMYSHSEEYTLFYYE